MATKRLFTETDQIYFITITCFNWINLFQITNFYSNIYKWFNFLNTKGKKIVGYVIMPNHLHLLIYIPTNSEPINKVVSEGKRFMAYDMVKILKNKNNTQLEEHLINQVPDFEKRRGKKHQIFITNSDIKPCFNEKMIEEKLDYIHGNPVNGKWSLVKEYTEYVHSSASFYELNIQGVFEITHYKDIIG